MLNKCQLCGLKTADTSSKDLSETRVSPLASSCLMLLDCVSKLSLFRTREDLKVLHVKVEAQVNI